MLYPLTFRPILKERVWGGRKLEQLYHKPLPPRVPVGESWEISDRAADVSVVANGPLAGKDLHWIVEQHGRELLGGVQLQAGRFPLLIKILDAEEKLSLQVHPPEPSARQLGGEPKTEMWYITHAEPGAELYVGLKRGVTRSQFERKIKDGTIADCFQQLQVKLGDAMFLPSGRVHAIGAGLVIFEIQQNSDTTYRVFDWNRVGLDGKPRSLHIKEALASIDFNDFEPQPVATETRANGGARVRALVRDKLFSVEHYEAAEGKELRLPDHRMQILAMVNGKLQVRDGPIGVIMTPGSFCLIPACLGKVTVQMENQVSFLRIEAGVE